MEHIDAAELVRRQRERQQAKNAPTLAPVVPAPQPVREAQAYPLAGNAQKG